MSKRHKNRFLLVSQDFPPPFIGGSLVYIHSLVENCPDSMDIFTSALPHNQKEVTNPRHKIIRSRFLIGSCRPSKFRLFIMYAFIVIWVFLKNIVRRYQVVVLNTGIIGNSLLILVLRFLRISSIVVGYAEEFTMAMNGRTFKNKVRRTLLNPFYKNAGGFLVVCSFTKDILVSMGVSPEKIAVIPPPLNKEKLPESRVKPVKNHHILSVGRLVARKGFYQLISAVAAVKNDIPDVKLTIVGNGPEKDGLTEKVRKLNLTDTIKIIEGASDAELASLYMSSSLFVLANLMLKNGDCEGAPIVFIEAGSYGLPLVGGITGGTSAVIDDGKNGFIVDPSDVNKLAHKMKEILLNPELADRMGREGIAKIERDHSSYMAGKAFHKFLTSASFQ